ncbi:surface-adhesin E family protein [Neisseriaceae bacterium B1]
MKKLAGLSMLLLLAACASTPKDPSAKAMGSWKEIGKIHSNNMAVAYDTGSLKVAGNTVSLRERKIVQKVDQENYLDLPEFKTAVSEWEFDCVKRTYRIKNAEFWDKNGKALTQQQYSAGQVPAMAIVKNTPNERLFDIACGKK